MNTKTQTKPSVTKEPGKTDKVADSSGAVHVEPESTNEATKRPTHTLRTTSTVSQSRRRSTSARHVDIS
jgi:hypothetical protein